ncbi:MAG TPA: hypothetical protein PK926_08085 [Spirochaetota bacterium]|nr:hypothetical protein [Spirochaetota bacterium]HPI88532.1 hypothetical protein [Spirochaetota bacterium]HPR48012.1 hypothetical protein [Spirochaetota bacterium]
MKKVSMVFIFMALLSSAWLGFACKDDSDSSGSTGHALWVRTVESGSAPSSFNSLAAGPDGIYAVGYIWGTGDLDFGNSQVGSGVCENTWNALIVKYDFSGNVQWVKTVISATDSSSLEGVAVGSDGIYAAGYIRGSGAFNFDDSVVVNGKSEGNNSVIVKYSFLGVTQFAATVTDGPGSSQFNSIAVWDDGTDEWLYAAGYIAGSGTFDFGNSATVVCPTSSSWNAVLVKYDTSGNALWGTTTESAPNRPSWFNSVSVSDSGIYIAGEINGTDEYDFGNSVKATGIYINSNMLLMKYNENGIAQWARTVVSGSSSRLNAVAVNDNGVYGAGSIVENIEYNFGNSVTVSGGHIFNDHLLLIKYNLDGTPQWANSSVDDFSKSSLKAVVLAGDEIYAAGSMGTSIDLGNGVVANGPWGPSPNVLLVRYNSDGNPVWAETVKMAYDISVFYSVVIADNCVYAAGYIYGDHKFDFGNNVKVWSESSADNISLVKYDR